MKKLITLAIGALLLASATEVIAQTAAPEAARDAQTPAPSRTVLVVGAVEKTGIYPFVENESVADLLARSGGAMARADLQKAYVLRGGVRIPFDWAQPKKNIPKLILREGDALVVPESQQRIFVVGDVVRPGSFALSEKTEITVREALDLAGGISSSPERARFGIVRSGKPNPTIEWHEWPKKDGDDVFRIPLKDGDGVYVKRQRFSSDAPFSPDVPGLIWPILPRAAKPELRLS